MTRSTFVGVRAVGVLLALVLAIGALQPRNAAAAALTLTKSVRNLTAGQTTFSTSTSAAIGDTLQYEIQFTNPGPDASNVYITDTPGTGQTLAGGCLPACATPSAGTVQWVFATMPSGTIGTLYFNVTVNSSASGTVQNYATANGPGATGTTTSGMSNTTTVTVVTTTTLSASKFVCPASSGSCTSTSITASPGDKILYIIVTRNTGTIAATSVTVSDTLQSAQTFVPMSCSPTCTNPTPNSVQFTTPTLTPGASFTTSFQATVNSGFSGSIINSATASASDAPLVPSNSTTVTVGVTPPPPTSGMTIAKAVANTTRGGSFTTSTTASNADTLTYRITVSNTGTSAISGVTITDPLGPGQVFQNYSCTGVVTCSYNSGTLTFSVGTINPGGTAAVGFRVTVAPGATGGIITNTASASAGGMPTISSNTTSVTVTPSGCTSNCNPCGSYCYPTGCTTYCNPCTAYSYACYPTPVYYPPTYFPPTFYQSPVLSTEVLCGVISGYRPPAGGAGYITVSGETIVLQPNLVPGGTAFNVGSAYCVTFSLTSNGQVASLTVSANLPASNYVCGTVTPYTPGYMPYPAAYGASYSPYPGYNPNMPYAPAPNYGPYAYPMVNGYYGWGGPMVIGGYPYQVSPTTYFPFQPQYNNPYCFLTSPQGVITGSLSVVPTAAREIESPSGYRKGHGINY